MRSYPADRASARKAHPPRRRRGPARGTNHDKCASAPHESYVLLKLSIANILRFHGDTNTYPWPACPSFCHYDRMISRKTKAKRRRAQGGDVEETERAHPSRITAQRQPRSEVEPRARNKAWSAYAPAVPQGGGKKLVAHTMDNLKKRVPRYQNSVTPRIRALKELIKWRSEYMTAMNPIVSTKQQCRKGESAIGGAY